MTSQTVDAARDLSVIPRKIIVAGHWVLRRNKNHMEKQTPIPLG